VNAIDILGGMLGRKSGGSSGGGLGGAILKSILKGKRGGSAAQPSGRESIPQRPAGSPTIKPSRGHQEFDSLEDLLRHAHNKHSTNRRQNAPSREPQRQPVPAAEPEIQRRQTDFTAEYEGNPDPFNQNAEVLIVAMANAAKADGQIDQAEQDAIIKELGDLSQDEVQFLRREFAKPLDVREFVWSVPLGMEQQVYAISLMTIELDNNAEARYLKELAHGFRMTPDECNQIHRRFGAPLLNG